MLLGTLSLDLAVIGTVLSVVEVIEVLSRGVLPMCFNVEEQFLTAIKTF